MSSPQNNSSQNAPKGARKINVLKGALKANDFNTPYQPTWCPGCGNFGIWTAIKNALAELGLPPSQVVIVYGIGCSGNMANTIRCYGFHSLHGRTLPVAMGVKLANQQLKVICVAGDGDAYGEGGNHLIHTARYNADVTLIVCNNHLFSLTTGQVSPTADLGMISKTTPWGEIKQPLNPLALSLAVGATFVARGAAFEIPHLTNLIKQAFVHRGFAHLDVLQQCVTLNKVNTVEWYKQRIYKLEEEGYKIDNVKKALDKALEKDKLPLGVFYQIKKPTYEQGFAQLRREALLKKNIVFKKKNLLKEFE